MRYYVLLCVYFLLTFLKHCIGIDIGEELFGTVNEEVSEVLNRVMALSQSFVTVQHLKHILFIHFY